MPKTDADNAPFSYEGLDRVMHEKARLGLLTSLMAHPKGLAFADLKQLCGLTDGNLSRHLQVLQEAGLVEVIKGYEGNRPHTSCRLTKSGRRRFLRLPDLASSPPDPFFGRKLCNAKYSRT
jgi:DNA-binding HxlR family transcriptional regulator